MLRSRTLRIASVAAVTLACIFPVEAQRWATVEHVAPILVADEIEAVLPFWQALGFEAVNALESEGKLYFVIIVKDGFAIHYQTTAYIEEQIPETTEILSRGKALLYINVDNLDTVVAALGDAEVVIPRRRTPWNTDEIYVKEPGGNIIAFAKLGGD